MYLYFSNRLWLSYRSYTIVGEFFNHYFVRENIPSNGNPKNQRGIFNITKHLLLKIIQERSIMKNPLCDELLLLQPTRTEHEDLYPGYIANCVFNAFFTITAIIFNSVTIQALRKSSSLPKPLRTLLLSLAVSDLGVGLLVQPLYIVLLVKWLHKNTENSPSCSLYTAFVLICLLCSCASFLGVMALSADRFLAIHLHLRYQELVTQKRVVSAVVSLWVLSVILS